MGDVSIFCPSCKRPNYPDEEQCWRCGAPLGKFVPTIPQEDAIGGAPSAAGSGSTRGFAHLNLTNLSDEEVVSRFRRTWLLEVLLGPAEVVLVLVFYLARDHWAGFLERISGSWVIWGLIALFLVVRAITYRCPRCHRSFFMRRLGYLRSCPRCGARFELPEQPQTMGLSSQRVRGWINNADHRVAISWLTPLLSLAIVVATPHILSASQASTILPLASPAVIATVAQQTSQLPHMTSYTDANGFTFEYPASWQAGSPTSTSTDTKLIAGVGRLDPSATPSANFYTDLIIVYVFRLGQAIDSSSYNHSERTFERDWLNAYPDIKLVQPWEQVSLGGLPGIEATCTLSHDGQSLIRTCAFVFDGTREFQLEVQATQANWPADKAAFDAFFQSFHVTNPSGVL